MGLRHQRQQVAGEVDAARIGTVNVCDPRATGWRPPATWPVAMLRDEAAGPGADVVVAMPRLLRCSPACCVHSRGCVELGRQLRIPRSASSSPGDARAGPGDRRRGGQVRVLGSRHSFNAIADSTELISLDGLPPDVAIDHAAGTVGCAAECATANWPRRSPSRASRCTTSPHFRTSPCGRSGDSDARLRRRQWQPGHRSRRA